MCISYVCIYNDVLTVPVPWASLSPRITQHFTQSVDRSVMIRLCCPSFLTSTWAQLHVAW